MAFIKNPDCPSCGKKLKLTRTQLKWFCKNCYEYKDPVKKEK